MGTVIGVLVLAVVGYSVATTPKAIPGRSPLTAFDAETVGRAEQKAWAAYYLHQWPSLFDLMLRMTRSAFGLSLPQAVYASYLNTYAQMVWSRQGAQDGLAEEYMRRSTRYVKQPTGGQVRRGQGGEARSAMVGGPSQPRPVPRSLRAGPGARGHLRRGVPATGRAAARPAGEARAAAMDLSDQWNREGKDPNSPLLEQIATLLVQSYQSLSSVATAVGQVTAVGAGFNAFVDPFSPQPARLASRSGTVVVEDRRVRGPSGAFCRGGRGPRAQIGRWGRHVLRGAQRRAASYRQRIAPSPRYSYRRERGAIRCDPLPVDTRAQPTIPGDPSQSTGDLVSCEPSVRAASVVRFARSRSARRLAATRVSSARRCLTADYLRAAIRCRRQQRRDLLDRRLLADADHVRHHV